jgi:hypothetical protein
MDIFGSLPRQSQNISSNRFHVNEILVWDDGETGWAEGVNGKPVSSCSLPLEPEGPTGKARFGSHVLFSSPPV